MSEKQKQNKQESAERKIERVIRAMSAKLEASIDKHLSLYRLEKGNAIVRDLKNTAVGSSLQSDHAKIRRIYLGVVEDILNESKLDEIINANIAVVKAKSAGSST